MKWFKHMSDAHRDPKLIALMDEFGVEGYGMWWIICEVVADQYKANGTPELETSVKGWRKLTGIYPKKFKKVLTFLEKGQLLFVTFSEKGIKVCLPKMQEFKDNHTRNLQAACKQEEEEEEEKKEERERVACAHVDPPPKDQLSPTTNTGPKKTPYPSKGRSSRGVFMACLQVFEDNKARVNEDSAWRMWCDMEDRGMLVEDMPYIRDQFVLLFQQDDQWSDGFSPSFTNCIKDRAWRNKPFKRPDNAAHPAQPGQQQPRATTQAQKNSQDREAMAMALLKAKETKRNAESQRGNNPHALNGVRPELPVGNDRPGPSAGTPGRLD
ncbi:hypothetical protein SYK_06870 [Pseudodesulfovibrio nedwellii]|uniref:DUF4373 domain-containing protein n=1 Tax=Pseudodesulfovibrio nedwellii TaxID=2973072 RepID=A0ABM8AXU5_9BACT|nr:hypothetical protein [Pseudodesulfovibrio nedwellii]BDQ36327.1 hypothetical protein SYK_06870 [Pseudodesulfovibrio nedwellii]